MAIHSSILGLENPMDTRAWRATVHRAAKSQIQLKRLKAKVSPEKSRLKHYGMPGVEFFF